MENFATDQDELYYTAKNFNKLKFSNTAYIENTTKDKQENQKEIEILKKEYEKLKNEVVSLKKKTLYTAGRMKSANNIESENSELVRKSFFTFKITELFKTEIRSCKSSKKQNKR